MAWIPRPGLCDLRILFHDYFGAKTAVAVLLSACCALLPPRLAAAACTAGRAGAPGPAWWRQRRGLAARRWRRRCWWCPAALLILESLVPVRCTSTATSSTARPERPCWPGPGALPDRAVAGRGDRPADAPLGARRGRLRVRPWSCSSAPQHRVRTPQSRLFDFGGPSRYLAAHARPGDGVLFFSNFFRKARLGYPADYRNVSDFAMAQSPAAAGNFQGRDKPVAVVQSLMPGYQRIWVVGRSPFAHLTAGPVRAEDTVLRSHFSLAAKRHFKGIFVTALGAPLTAAPLGAAAGRGPRRPELFRAAFVLSGMR